MNKYEMIIYWSEADCAYIAEVPELAGCMADGKTRAEALQNAELVITEWLETALSLGRDIPAPRNEQLEMGN
jgi:predicted RNase H-like HicB family nuclease